MSRVRILSVDLGTTSMKTVLFDEGLSIVAKVKTDYGTEYPAPGWAEQDPCQWWDALKTSVARVLTQSDTDPSDVAVLAIDAMTPTVVPVNADGEALRNAILWMDRRSEKQCDFLDQALGDDLFKVSGNHNDPSNMSPKILWVKDQEPEIYAKADKFLYATSYLIKKLTGIFAQDKTQCGLSQLCDTLKSDWDPVLIAGSGIDKSKLAPLYESTEIVGSVTQTAARETGLSPATKVIAGAMDNVAAGMGAGVAKAGDLYLSAGTASNVCVCSDAPVYHQSFHVYRHMVPGLFIHAAGVDYGGAGYKWFAKLIDEKDYAALDASAEAVPLGERPLVFLPYMVGQRAPLWNSDTRGVLFGLEPSLGAAEMARAMMEGNAMGVKKILSLVERLGVKPSAGRLTGGCGESRVYSQIFADVLDLEIHRVGEMDTAPLGTAMAGAYAIGLYDDFTVMTDKVALRAVQEPSSQAVKYYQRLFPIFEALYATAQESYRRLGELRNQYDPTRSA